MPSVVLQRAKLPVSASARILHECGIDAFPVSISAIVKKLGISCSSYQSLARSNGISVDSIAKTLASEDGAAMLVNGKRYIAYNNDMPLERKRFTLAHEIGHIVMGHLDEIKGFRLARSSLSSGMFFSYEQEANDFARNLLAPAAVHAARKNRHIRATSYFFNISSSCANIRCITYEKDMHYLRSEGVYDLQIAQFSGYLEKHPEGLPLKNKCLNNKRKTCGIYLGGDWLRCPYCGAMTKMGMIACMEPLEAYRDIGRRKKEGKNEVHQK